MAIRRLGVDDEDYISNRTIIATAIVAQLFQGAVVKGGASLKIRFGNHKTRATTDLDVSQVTKDRSFIRDLEEKLAVGWEGFTARLVELPRAHPKDVPEHYVMQPYEIKLSYLGRPWCTVMLEVGHNEIEAADKMDMLPPRDAQSMLTAMGFPKLGLIPVMTLPYQVAQKLHGVSEPMSQRAHDLVDLQLIIANGDVDLALVAETCMRLFSYRRMQKWPPTISVNDGWESLYSEAAMELNVLDNVEDAVKWANDLIDKIVNTAKKC